jgi:hypothetical protein
MNSVYRQRIAPLLLINAGYGLYEGLQKFKQRLLRFVVAIQKSIFQG